MCALLHSVRAGISRRQVICHWCSELKAVYVLLRGSINGFESYMQVRKENYTVRAFWHNVGSLV